MIFRAETIQGGVGGKLAVPLHADIHRCAREATRAGFRNGLVVALALRPIPLRVLINQANRGIQMPCGERMEARRFFAGRFACHGNAL
jgi:hypothetical protein